MPSRIELIKDLVMHLKNNFMRLLNKAVKATGNIFFRLYPWQVNFFYETLEYNPLSDIVNFISKNDIQTGGFIGAYENEFKALIDQRGWAFSLGTGRMALYAALEAMDIGKGDEVILPAFTCEVVVHALLYRGIKPVYADIEPFTLNIDVDNIEGKITKYTKAIIAQHTFGQPCQLDKILSIAEKHALFVIEDCALSLGASYNGKPVGSFGDAAIFSTDKTKITSTLFGGLVFTKNAELAKKIEKIYSASKFLSKPKIANIAAQVVLSCILFSPYGYFWGKYIFKAGYKFSFFFDHKDDKDNFRLPEDYPCRLSNFQSFLGMGQLRHLQENLRLRDKTVKEYISILESNGIKFTAGIHEQTRLRFSLLLKNKKDFQKKWNKYFEVGNWFDSPALGWYSGLEKIGYKHGGCPVAEKIHRHIVNFPTHQTSPKIRDFLLKIMQSIKNEDLLTTKEILE